MFVGCDIVLLRPICYSWWFSQLCSFFWRRNSTIWFTFWWSNWLLCRLPPVVGVPCS